VLFRSFHQDHFEGLAEFAPAYTSGFKLNLGGANDPDQTLQDSIRKIFESAPPELGTLRAELQLYQMVEQSYEMFPGMRVSSFFANHPGTTLGFVVETQNRKMVYCPDSEIYGEQGTALQDYDERLTKIVRGADVMIHDARYLESDYENRKNNGHSSWKNTVELAIRAKVKRLVLFHHDDGYGDAILDRIEADAMALSASKRSDLEILMAREGLKLGF
jgi:phosphoribosyl 1,2-cyclic phosphodiesterase